MGEKKTKNVVIIALCLTLIFMGVGFAALSQNINIEATGTVSAKTAWDVRYASFALNGSGGNAADTTPEATEGRVKYLDTSKTTATVNFTLTAPGDYVEYKGTITNFGSIDAKLSTYTSSFNTDKILMSSNEQIKDINLIVEKLGEEFLDEKLLEAANYRCKYPESSLLELSEIMSMETGKNITKSGLNHRFRKIKEIASRLRSNDK